MDRPRAGTTALVWGVGLAAYVFTVMQRTTLSAAGLDAAHRFGINAGQLSLFVFLQVAVFTATQIPAGLLVDRFGARRLLVVNGLLLAAGQILLATTDSLPVAISGRVLVGVGDAIVFAATLALVPRWFAPPRVPLMTQLTTIGGQVGQILSAIPFAAVLHTSGWTVAFLGAAGASLLTAVLSWLVVRNSPDRSWQPVPITSARQVGRSLREVWRRPGTRVGFFGHMVVQFPMMVFTVLWGVPYLVSGQGLTPTAAGGLITLYVVCNVAFGPILGVLTGRHPLRRSWLILTVVAAQVLVWTAVLAVAGPAPRWLLIVLVVILAAGGPGSVVGLDIARTANPGSSIGLAQGIANLGGFLATLVTLAAMGVVITLAGGFSPPAFRLAWLVLYPVWAFALIMLVRARRVARRFDAARGITPRPLREVVGAALAR